MIIEVSLLNGVFITFILAFSIKKRKQKNIASRHPVLLKCPLLLKDENQSAVDLELGCACRLSREEKYAIRRCERLEIDWIVHSF